MKTSKKSALVLLLAAAAGPAFAADMAVELSPDGSPGCRLWLQRHYGVQ